MQKKNPDYVGECVVDHFIQLFNSSDTHAIILMRFTTQGNLEQETLANIYYT